MTSRARPVESSPTHTVRSSWPSTGAGKVSVAVGLLRTSRTRCVSILCLREACVLLISVPGLVYHVNRLCGTELVGRYLAGPTKPATRPPAHRRNPRSVEAVRNLLPICNRPPVPPGCRPPAPGSCPARQDAIQLAGSDLAEDLRAPCFFVAEYAMVVLPARVPSAEAYLRASRPGRGQASTDASTSWRARSESEPLAVSASPRARLRHVSDAGLAAEIPNCPKWEMGSTLS